MRGVTGTVAALMGMPERGMMLPDTLIPTRVSFSIRLGSAPDSGFAALKGHGSPGRSCRKHHLLKPDSNMTKLPHEGNEVVAMLVPHQAK